VAISPNTTTTSRSGVGRNFFLQGDKECLVNPQDDFSAPAPALRESRPAELTRTITIDLLQMLRYDHFATCAHSFMARTFSLSSVVDWYFRVFPAALKNARCRQTL
jgi:hypothetical protein